MAAALEVDADYWAENAASKAIKLLQPRLHGLAPTLDVDPFNAATAGCKQGAS
jgi:hypothetical protein